MATYNINIQLKNAGTTDYESLGKEMGGLKKKDGESHYQGEGSLQEITAAVYRAARNTGKEYSFTIIRQKKAV